MQQDPVEAGEGVAVSRRGEVGFAARAARALGVGKRFEKTIGFRRGVRAAALAREAKDRVCARVACAYRPNTATPETVLIAVTLYAAPAFEAPAPKNAPLKVAEQPEKAHE